VRSVALTVSAAALLLVAMPSSAALPVSHVYIQFAAYGPGQLDVLPGQRVLWTNVSPRTHTVTSDDRLFDSGDVSPDSRFSLQFNTPGIYRYHCTIHAGIVGEVDVRKVILDGLPTAAVPVGTPVEFDGRTATPGQPVLVQRREGTSFRTVVRVKPGANGSWKARIEARTTTDFRAVSGSAASETRRLLVSERKVHVRPTSSGVAVSVTPAAPYAPYLVEVYLRERFGWWPVARGETDYVSEASVRIRRRPARVRIVLVDRDGWTPLATSPVVQLPKR